MHFGTAQNQYEEELQNTSDEQSKKEAKIQIGLTITLAVFIMISGVIFFHYYEGLTWLDSWYFVVITLTTVGYGDITPQTSLGKFITPIFVILGIGMITSLITGVNKYLIQRRINKFNAKHNTSNNRNKLT